jgi:hypothetical protein
MDLLCTFVYSFSLFGKLEFPIFSVQKLYSKLRLKLPHMDRNARLCHKKVFCRAGETAIMHCLIKDEHGLGGIQEHEDPPVKVL